VRHTLKIFDADHSCFTQIGLIHLHVQAFQIN